jgi:hypothetical protein
MRKRRDSAKKESRQSEGVEDKNQSNKEHKSKTRRNMKLQRIAKRHDKGHEPTNAESDVSGGILTPGYIQPGVREGGIVFRTPRF